MRHRVIINLVVIFIATASFVASLYASTDSERDDKLLSRAKELRDNPNATAKDTAEFVEIYRKLAESYPWAQVQMGLAYQNGWAVTPDSVEAYKWYSKAAEQGHLDGMYIVGQCMVLGWGTAQNDTAGIRWLKQSSDQGWLAATAYLGKMYFEGTASIEKNESLALNYLEIAADSGDIPSQRNIVWLAGNPESDSFDPPLAMKWSQELANDGEAEFQRDIGLYYYEGEYVDTDFEIAGKYFALAAAQKDPGAELLLAVMCYEGTGTETNYVQSLGWTNRVLSHGDEAQLNMAKEILDSLSLVITSVQRDSARTAELKWIPLSESGHSSDSTTAGRPSKSRKKK